MVIEPPIQTSVSGWALHVAPEEVVPVASPETEPLAVGVWPSAAVTVLAATLLEEDEEDEEDEEEEEEEPSAPALALTLASVDEPADEVGFAALGLMLVPVW